MDKPDNTSTNHAKLAKKMAEVIKKSGKVKKEGHNDYQNYSYATHADIVEELRKTIAEEGIFILPHPQEFSLDQTLTTIHMDFEIIDTETGYGITVNWIGQGMDKGDKGIYKAYTGALKYFLLDTFMISTGDDPEKESPENKPGNPAIQIIPMSEDQKKRLLELLPKKGKTEDDLETYAVKTFHVHTWTKMTFAQTEVAIKKLYAAPDIQEEHVDTEEVNEAIK